MLIKSKNKGFSSSSSFWPFFFGLTAFFFFAPSLFSSSNLFSCYFFFVRYSSSSFSFSSQFFFSLRFHFIRTFFPSKGHSLTVLMRSRYLWYSSKSKVDFLISSRVLMNSAPSSKLVNLSRISWLTFYWTFFLNSFTISLSSSSPHFFFLAFLTQSALILSTSSFLALRSYSVSVSRGSLKGTSHISSSFLAAST